jgi:phosphoribosyl 1,2-cyclic phosphate phosphodiesterase
VATLRFTILGCGSSPGVPRPNGDWGACDPDEPRNKRLRTSLLVQRKADDGAVTSVVIDTSPDFRQQILNASVKRLDAVVYTHAHADHVHGIDDLRSFVLAQNTRIPIHADGRTMARLKSTFDYIFERLPGSDYPPIADARTFETGDTITVSGQGGKITLTPFPLEHAGLMIKGFRIGAMAYCTDVSGFPERSLRHVAGVEVLVIGALQYRPHPSHLSLAQALDWIGRLEPKRAILTHMHVPLDYRTVLAETPDHVEPGYDGMVFELPDHER